MKRIIGYPMQCRATALLIFTFGLYGCTKPEDVALKQVKAHLEAHLIDPGSIQYRNEAIKADEKKAGGYIVCLEFNSKNRLGGYVGFTTDYCKVPPKSSGADDVYCMGLASKIEGQKYDAKTVALAQALVPSFIKSGCEEAGLIK